MYLVYNRRRLVVVVTRIYYHYPMSSSVALYFDVNGIVHSICMNHFVEFQLSMVHWSMMAIRVGFVYHKLVVVAIPTVPKSFSFSHGSTIDTPAYLKLIIIINVNQSHYLLKIEIIIFI